MAKVTKKKVKLRLLPFLIFIVTCVLLYFATIYILNMPIKNVIIKGNNNLSDYEIMTLAGVDDYPSFFKTTSKSIKNNLLNNPYITSVKIEKRFFNVLVININEAYGLYYDSTSSELVLSNDKRISLLSSETISPVLLNYIPNTKIDSFISNMKLVNIDILDQISEIEYIPNEYDKDRFILYMDDSNSVYLTLTKFDQINFYNDVLPQLEGKKGILYLDSGNHFQIMG